MTIEELKNRREQIVAAMNQNSFVMQGHLQEVDFQMSELTKAQAALDEAQVDQPAVNLNEVPVD